MKMSDGLYAVPHDLVNWNGEIIILSEAYVASAIRNFKPWNAGKGIIWIEGKHKTLRFRKMDVPIAGEPYGTYIAHDDGATYLLEFTH